jgi:precorrin-4 methylase
MRYLLKWCVIQLEEYEEMSKFEEILATIQTDVAEASTVVEGVLRLVTGLPSLFGAVAEQVHAVNPLSAAQTAVFDEANTALNRQARQLASAVASSPSGNVQPGEGVTHPASMETQPST